MTSGWFGGGRSDDFPKVVVSMADLGHKSGLRCNSKGVHFEMPDGVNSCENSEVTFFTTFSQLFKSF